jgi:hypothetical protein
LSLIARNVIHVANGNHVHDFPGSRTDLF